MQWKRQDYVLLRRTSIELALARAKLLIAYQIPQCSLFSAPSAVFPIAQSKHQIAQYPHHVIEMLKFDQVALKYSNDCCNYNGCPSDCFGSSPKLLLSRVWMKETATV